ncbi:ribonuclease HII [Candidatus Dojkabacteria bacterium]|uniref:Ribonuclease n=1 Tax=Candidatus Dojkabacteria bacterium TaxID=2099670 RepID=A0A955L217_9BACT|nr:ribonuclease HII [Candidatus Dojkabacteria bacterium]
MQKLLYLKPSYEINLLSNNENKYTRVIGIDEVGRGSWAGPVAVGAYYYNLNSEFVQGIKDSKQLTLKRRETLFSILKKHEYKVSYGSVDMIDKYGIGKTIEKLILQIVNKESNGNTLFLIDGIFSQNFGDNSLKIIKGDTNYYSIAAASVLAKVTRDHFMDKLEDKYQGYGFDKHKGYGTKQHIEALNKLGINKKKKKSYKSVSKLM